MSAYTDLVATLTQEQVALLDQVELDIRKDEREAFAAEARLPLGHVATPGFIFTGSTGKVERCRICRRYLRSSRTSPTGWRHSGRNG